MKSTGWSLQRALTWAGLGLLALALLVVLLNLIRPVPEGDPFRGPWILLKLLIADLLVLSWVLLNIPQPKPPSGQFVLAIAQFGELQVDGSGWRVVPGQRALSDQVRALLPAPLTARLTRPAADGRWAAMRARAARG